MCPFSTTPLLLRAQLHVLLQLHQFHPFLLAAFLQLLDPRFCPGDLLADEIQPTVHGVEGLDLVLFQQHGADQLVNARVVGERGELLLDGLVFLLLRLEFLAGVNGTLKIWLA